MDIDVVFSIQSMKEDTRTDIDVTTSCPHGDEPRDIIPTISIVPLSFFDIKPFPISPYKQTISLLIQYNLNLQY